MRTTLAIDDDVLAAVRERARREGRTAGEVLSELARQALTGAARPVASGDALYGFDPFPLRGQAVSNELIDRLRDDEGV